MKGKKMLVSREKKNGPRTWQYEKIEDIKKRLRTGEGGKPGRRQEYCTATGWRDENGEPEKNQMYISEAEVRVEGRKEVLQEIK